MIDLSDKKILVMDYRNHVSVAIRLAKDYGTVFYWCPYVMNGFPEHTPFDVARGVENIVKVKEWASVIMESDIVIFTDSQEPYLQNFIRSVLGKPVYGSVFACELEHDRSYLKETMKSLGLPVSNYSIANGIDELDELLKNSNGVRYIKSGLRGDMETFKHTDYRLTKRELIRMKHEMGLYGSIEKYIVEHPIDGVCEIGYDGWCIHGQYPDITMCGIEIKDAGYLGKFEYYKLLPEQLRLVNDSFSNIFKEMGYRGQYSNEVIISKDKRGFLIDQTCRIPEPPGSLMLLAYKNYSEIVWDVANGRMPNIEFDDKWGVELIIKSDMAESDLSPVIVPDEYKEFVTIKNLSIDEDGTWFFVPSPNLKMKEIGAVVATGKTMDEAMKKAKEIADSIEGFDTYIKTDSLDKAKKSLDKLSKAGISFI